MDKKILFKEIKFTLGFIVIFLILFFGAFQYLFPYILKPGSFWARLVFIILSIPLIWFFLWGIVYFVLWLLAKLKYFFFSK